MKMNRVDTRAIPDRPGEIRMFVVGVDAGALLPHLLDHHFAIGIDRVFYIDNCSSDDSVEQLLGHDNVHVWSQAETFTSDDKTRWTMDLLDAYGRGYWCLVVDTDELFVYPGYEDRSIRQFLQEQEQNGVDCVATRFIDLYPRGRVGETRIEGSLVEAMPYFDPGDYGVRQRIMGFEPDVCKMPLFKFTAKITPISCFHSVRGFGKLSPDHCALLHFKFHSDYQRTFLQHLKKMSHAAEKAKVYDGIRGQVFYDEAVSRRYNGSASLTLYDEFWRHSVGREKLLKFRRERDFSHVEYSIKKFDNQKETCLILVGCYNHFEVTRRLVDSLCREQDDTYNYIHLFIDDGSETPDTARFFLEQLEEVPINIVFARHIENMGLTAVWNNGLNLYPQADYCILLNNDTVVAPGWAHTLIECAKKQGDLCAVGPVTNHANTRAGLQDVNRYSRRAGKLTAASDVGKVNRKLRWKRPRKLGSGDFLSGFCLLLPRAALDDTVYRLEDLYTWYFDPQRLHYGNEMEFFSRFRHPLYVLPRVFVYHEGEVSIRDFESEFAFLYAGDRINQDLVNHLVEYFLSIGDEQEYSKRSRALQEYMADHPCQELADILRRDTQRLEAHVRILRRQARQQDSVPEAVH